MSSLVILNGANELDVDGYASLVENVILNEGLSSRNFDAVADYENPSGRVNALQEAVQTTPPPDNDSTGATVFLYDGANKEPVGANNCQISNKKDESGNGNSPAKISIPLPEAHLSPADLSYLDIYIKKLFEVYVVEDDKDKAYKFLFGMMMLTKCR